MIFANGIKQNIKNEILIKNMKLEHDEWIKCWMRIENNSGSLANVCQLL